MLTSPSPSNGPALEFIINLMKTLNVKMSDFKTSELYTKILQVIIPENIIFERKIKIILTLCL